MTDAALRTRYDALWDEAAPLVRAGRAELDPIALAKDADRRRGVTLLARPDDEAAAPLVALQDELRAREPGQYWQPRADLHLTVLSLFTATADFPRHLALLPTYRAAVEEALEVARPFEVALTGVTLSTGALLAQGYPADDTLEQVRGRLREAMRARGRGDDLDQRYRLETAHLTLARFAAPLADAAGFVDAVATMRDRPLGVLRVERLELVLGDWYQTSERETEIEAYELGAE